VTDRYFVLTASTSGHMINAVISTASQPPK
jgi:hypothetical protein